MDSFDSSHLPENSRSQIIHIPDQEKNDFDSSTTFVFASNNVQFQKESVISITCNVLDDVKTKVIKKGTVVDYVKLVDELL